MSPSLLALTGLGLLLGFRHTFEPDHLAAVSTLATRQGRLLDACRLGLAWAVGHTASVGVVVAVIMIFGIHLPDRLWPAADFLVALLLIWLGASVMLRYARARPPGWGRKALARVRAAPWARRQRRNFGPTRGSGAHSYRSVRVLRCVRAGHHDRYAAGLVLARRAGTARVGARGDVGDGPPLRLSGHQRGGWAAARGKDTAIETSL